MKPGQKDPFSVQVTGNVLWYHTDTGIMRLPAFLRPRWSAVIVPGILFGILYPAIFFTAYGYLESAGLGEPHSLPVSVLILVIPPVLLFITGGVAEQLRRCEGGTGRTAWTSYLAGFLGTAIAISLLVFGSYTTKDTPGMAPGLLSRLAYVGSMEIQCLPILLACSIIFAVFALAGGVFMYGGSKQTATGSQKSA